MDTSYFQLHDFLSFQIHNDGNLVRNRLDTARSSFVNFRVAPNRTSPDFTIEIGKFERKTKDCIILDDGYHIGRDYIYYEGQRKFAKWKIEIENLETAPLIRIWPNLAGCVTQALHLVEFFIQYCLLKKGVSAIHASALSSEGKVILLPGTSGGGKTTISLSLVEKGFHYLGDNYILIRNGKAYSYLTPLNIFSYNRVPIVENNLSIGQKMSLMVRKLIFDMTRGYIKIFMKINPKDIFQKQFDHEGTIAQICFLEPNDKFDSHLAPPRTLKPREAVRKLRYNMELEWMSFIRLMYSYGYLYPDSLLGTFWTTFESVLSNNLNGHIGISSLGVPSWYQPEIKKAVVNSVHQLHHSA